MVAFVPLTYRVVPELRQQLSLMRKSRPASITPSGRRPESNSRPRSNARLALAQCLSRTTFHFAKSRYNPPYMAPTTEVKAPGLVPDGQKHEPRSKGIATARTKRPKE